MDKLNKLDKITDEYMLYEVGVIPSSTSDVKQMIDIFVDDMDVTMKTSISAMRENIRDEQLAKIKNFLLDLVGYEGENIERYDRDNGIILRINCLANRYKDYFFKMRDAISDDNYVDIFKLAMFAYDNFLDNCYHLQSVRHNVRLAADGIEYQGWTEDTQGEFSEFFRNVFSGVKRKDKTYKKVVI